MKQQRLRWRHTNEWLAISEENYVASIEYVDENYLCLSMNSDSFVMRGTQGSYWSDYYVFPFELFDMKEDMRPGSLVR